jgi:cell division protein ZipA
MANMVRPGVFDLSQMDHFSTPGVVLFLTLPGPLSALDAWDTMLPAAQRFSELLGAQLLDDQRTPLGRQRIAALRDELRAIDRKREQLQIKPGW